MRVQRTRRPSLCSGRSRCSLGSPLTRYPLGAVAKACGGPRTLKRAPRLRLNSRRRSASIAASQGPSARPAAVAIPGRAAHPGLGSLMRFPAPPSPSDSRVQAQNRSSLGVNLKRNRCA